MAGLEAGDDVQLCNLRAAVYHWSVPQNQWVPADNGCSNVHLLHSRVRRTLRVRALCEQTKRQVLHDLMSPDTQLQRVEAAPCFCNWEDAAGTHGLSFSTPENAILFVEAFARGQRLLRQRPSSQQRQQQKENEEGVACPLCDEVYSASTIAEHAMECDGSTRNHAGVACPLCLEHFHPDEIMAHASACCGTGDSSQEQHAAPVKKQPKRDEGELCSVCWEGELNTLLLPCAHLCVCEQCASTLSLCPLCRTAVQRKVRVYKA